ncbi:MAG: adenylate/guanylate cyclase domain-containing protein [Proteobacteria bacterium]|nr:adenylate/guanylate cyclase domain-containing protein [Pseudomonadota bacterium]
MQRKLTVILSADIVGYSALMERDESGTLARLKENRKSLFDPRVASQGGRTFKVMGDGVLVELPSASSAVTCALDIQDAMEVAEAHRPETDRLRYRIGINLGDVIVEGDDMYGEGVNVAARLQALAEAGGIAVSRNVRDQVAGKVAAEFDDLGPQTVKNIETPVHVFAVRPKTLGVTTAAADKQQKMSICVLPFVNMSGDSEQEYFSDGISEDIITDLSKVSALWVAARNTSFTFKGKPVDVQQVTRNLKVSHVLEGSVRKARGRVRITAQLIDSTGGHVWAERWDRDLNDIFALQDEISEAIVKALKLKLLPEEKRAIERRGTSNAEAYELFLLARQFERTGSERMKPLIVRICERALELDPSFARSWALMSMAKAELSQRGISGFTMNDAQEAAERAVSLAPDLAEGYAALAEALGRGPEMNLAEGEAAIETALKLDPQCYDAHVFAGYIALGQRRYHDSLRHLETAIALDADAYRPAGMVVQVYEALGDRAGALAAARRLRERCERLLRLEPDHSGALGFFVNALADLGEVDRAREWTKRAVLFDPDNMRLHYNLACGMVKVDADFACELLERILPRMTLGWLRWMDIDNSLDPIRTYPRFKAIYADVQTRLAAETER